MNKKNVVTYSLFGFILLSSFSIKGAFIFYGISSYAIPVAYGLNEAKEGRKFFGFTRSKFGFGDISGLKINTDQFNSAALDTRSYDGTKLLFNTATPFIVATITRLMSLPGRLLIHDFLNKAPVKVIRGGTNGFLSVAAMIAFNEMKKNPEAQQLISEMQKDPEAQQLISEIKKEIKKVKSEFDRFLKK